ncbi:hypothetical protein [Chamaesiphon sp.]|uniref:hypothetical protein n=1 Tax=Chamaesiphon sp. TaxID=2814140 RepID=UPI00359393C9
MKKAKSPRTKTTIGVVRIKHKDLNGKVKKLRPLEAMTHLQAVINYTLEDGRQAGALLLNLNRSLDKPEYKIRFFWECQGFHDAFSADGAIQIVNSIAALGRELPLYEKLRVEFQTFCDYRERQAELVELFENSPSQYQRIIAEKIKILQDLDTKGKRRPKRIFLMGDYTPNSEELKSDVLEKIIRKGMNLYHKISGAIDDIRQEAVDKTMLKAYEQGFLAWEDLFRDKLQAKFTPLSGEEVWQFCYNQLNRFGDRLLEREPPLAPQLIEFDLRKGTIVENIRDRIHPTSLMLLQPAAIPTSNRDYVAVDGKYVGSMLLKSQPSCFQKANGKNRSQVQLNYLWTLLDKRAARDMRIVLEISRIEDSGVRFNNQKLIREAHNWKKAKEAKGQIDVGAGIQLEEAIEAEKKAIGGDPTVEFALTMYLYRDSASQLRHAARELSSYFLSPANLILEVDTSDEVWTSSLPFYGKSMLTGTRDRRDRERPIYTAAYFPLVNTVSNHRTGLEFIATRGGSPIYFDPFKHKGHTMVLGKTRSGKSLVMAEIIELGLSQGVPHTILDQPPSKDASTFEDFTNRLKGSYIDIFNVPMNFLETPTISLELSEETRSDLKKNNESYILKILRAMVLGYGSDARNVNSSLVTSLLPKILKRFFEDGQIQLRYDNARRAGLGSPEWKEYPILQDIVRFCGVEWLKIKDANAEIVDTLAFIKAQLEGWIDGVYGKTLNAPSAVKLDNPLITIAMRGVSNDNDAIVFGTIAQVIAMRRAIATANDGKGSVFFMDEASSSCKLAPLSLAFAETVANGLKAGMRIFFAAQEPESVFSSAGGTQIKDGMSYYLIGRIGDSLPNYTNPDILGVPEDLARINASEDFLPDKATGRSSWLLKIGDRWTHGSIYLAPSLILLTANNIEERLARKAASVTN